MNKRGQFYIIIAVIFSVVLYTLTIQENKIEEPILFEDFDDISQNYVTEAPKVVNYAYYVEENVTETLPDFTEDFLRYARLKNPTISLLYVYNNQRDVNFRSYLHETAVLSTNTTTQELFGASETSVSDMKLKVAGKDFIHHIPMSIKQYGEDFFTSDIPYTDWVSIQVGGIFHNFKLDDNAPQLEVFLTSKEGDTTQVYRTGDPNAQFPIKF